jgi:prevent-host-death family protein
MQSIGLFDAKTHFSEYVMRAEAGEELVITRHNKPVAKIVPFNAADEAKKVPKFVQRTFAMGGLLVAETNMNKLNADLEDEYYIEKMRQGR